MSLSSPVPSRTSSGRVRRTIILAIAYALPFLVASWLDLWTTSLALTQPGASEGNVYATDGGAYLSGRAWAMTAIGGAMIEAFLLFAGLSAERVADHWLDRPMRSFTRVYINPWARSVIDRSPLHALSYVLAFVPLRLLAAINNALIWKTGAGPLGEAIGVLSHWIGATGAFWLVMGPLFCLMAVAISPVAAKILRWVRAG